MMPYFFFMIIVFVVSFVLTGYMQHYAVTKNIVDHPNHRSSHTVPTPRGGGLVFVSVFLLTIPCLLHWQWIAWGKTAALNPILVGVLLLIALLGFWDDCRSISARIRLLGHVLVSILAVVGLHGMPSLVFFADIVMPIGLLSNGFAVLYLVWMLNLYNFMDGIDGIAALEAILVCSLIAIIYAVTGGVDLIALPLMLAASVAGFLHWNFPAARIFMGDVGSSFLGLCFGVLSIQATMMNPMYFWCWMILLGAFIVDTTLTLIRRLVRGDNPYEAHRNHAYQHAARFFDGHVVVTRAIFAVNLLWLFPIALLVGLGCMNGVLGVLIAYTPLVLLAFQFQAGQPE